MGPPPRSQVVDADACIMVRASWPTEYKVAAHLVRPANRLPSDHIDRTTAPFGTPPRNGLMLGTVLGAVKDAARRDVVLCEPP